ncbi:MAG TPA: ester cyclase [Streptosporangiaceae bacterium]
MPVHSMTTAEAAVRRFYEPLNTGDTTLIDETLAPDWEVTPALAAGPGAEGWKAAVEYLRQVFTELTVTIEDAVVDGDTVAVRLAVRGVHANEFFGVPGTGRQVEFQASDFHRVVDGRIRQSWHLEDYFGLAAQIGLRFSL